MWASLNVSSTNVCPLSLVYNSNSPLDAILEWTRKAFDRKCYSPNKKCPPQVYVLGYLFSHWGHWFWRLQNLLNMGLTLRGCVSLKATDCLHFLKSYYVSTLCQRPSCSKPPCQCISHHEWTAILSTVSQHKSWLPSDVSVKYHITVIL